MENGRHGEPTHTARKAAVQVPRLRREHAPIQVLNMAAYRAADQPYRHKPAILNIVKLRQHPRQPQLQDQQLFPNVSNRLMGKHMRL